MDNCGRVTGAGGCDCSNYWFISWQMMTWMTSVCAPLCQRGKNDVHYYLCNYFACDPWNYPSNNTFIATVSLEPLVLGVRPCLQQFCILLFPEWTPDIVTCGTECRFFISEFKKKTQQNALLGEKTVSRMEVIS